MRKAFASAVSSLPSSVSDAEVPDVNGLALKAMSLGKDLFKKGLDPPFPPTTTGLALHTQPGRWGKTKSPPPPKRRARRGDPGFFYAAPRPRRRIYCHTPAAFASYPSPLPLIPFHPPLVPAPTVVSEADPAFPRHPPQEERRAEPVRHGGQGPRRNERRKVGAFRHDPERDFHGDDG